MNRFADRVPLSARLIDAHGNVSAQEILGQKRTFPSCGCIGLRGGARFLLEWLLKLDGVAQRILLAPFAVSDAMQKAVDNEGSVTDWLIEGSFLPSSVAESSGIVGSSELPRITEWVLMTSGTTRTPKLVAHRLDSLTRSIKVNERFRDYRWGLMYDPARFAGLQVLLQSMLNGATLLAPTGTWSLSDQVDWLVNHQCDALSATPTLWRKLMMVPGCERLPLRLATLGGEIADGATLSAVRRTFSKARVTHIYASTEAGVGFAVHDGLPGFPSDWLKHTNGLEGQPTTEPTMEALQARLTSSCELTIGENGCLWVRPGRVTQKYLGTNESLTRDDGWIDTGDVVRLENDRVRFLGRLNGSINVGGNKLYPEEIEGIILQVEGVSATRVRGRPSSLMGNLVEALVVPEDQKDISLATRVKDHCREKLESFKVPAFVKLVKELDISAAGKIVRSA